MAQLIISVAGAAAGFAIGGPQGALIGYQIGSTVGAAFAPAQKVSGPKITDGKITGTEYGQPLRYIDGRDRHAGQLVWASKVRPIKNTTTTGGKGGGVKSTTYTYQVDLLYIVSDVEIAGVPRCWVNGKLVRNLLDTADAATLQASTESEYWSDFLVYSGDYSQLPDPTYEADKGVGSTPALRGRGYVLLKDFELGSSINIPNISFEVVTALTDAMRTDERLAWTLDNPRTSTPSFNQAGFYIETYAYPSYIATTWKVAPSGRVKLQGSRSFAAFFTAGYNQVRGCADLDVVVWDLPGHDGFLLERIGGGLSATFISPAVGLGAPGDESLAIRGNDVVIVLAVVGGHIARFNLAGGVAQASAIGYGGGSVGLQIAGDKVYWANSSGGPVKEFDLATMAFIRDLPAIGASINYLFTSDVGELYSVDGDDIYKFDGTAWSYLAGGSTHISGAGIGGAPAATMIGNTLYNHSGVEDTLLEMWAITVNPTMEPASQLLPDVVSRLCLRAGLTSGQIDVSELPATPVLGLGLGQVTTTRQALELLAQAYFFSCRCSDKLYFFPTFTAPVLTIPFADLGASANGEAEPLSIKTLADLEKPTHVALSYSNIDAAYNTGTAYPNGRLATQDSTSAAALPLVLTSTEAQAIVDTTQQDSIAYLFDTRLALTHQYARLEPGDVVSVAARNGNTYALRLGKRTEAGGVITFECRSHDASVSITAGLGGGAYTAPDTVVALPYSDAEYMDIPLLQDADDGAAVTYVVAKGAAAGWPGAAVYKGPDADNLEQASIATVAGVFGVCDTALADWPGALVDEAGGVTVNVGAGELSSITHAQLLSSTANAALVGDELVQFRQATLISAGVYRLAGLRRGLRGTERFKTTHVAGERFVLLSADSVRRIRLETFELNAARFYRTVTLGRALSSGDDESLTSTGQSLSPLAPVDVRAERAAGTVSVLLHFNGTNGSGVFTDSAGGLPFTAAAGAVISTAQSVFGGASGAFLGGGARITTPHSSSINFLTGNYTIEFRYRPAVLGISSNLVLKSTTTGDTQYQIFINTSNRFVFQAYNSGGSVAFTITGTTVANTSNFYAVAAVAEGNTYRLYVNGVQEASTTVSYTRYSNVADPLSIGAGSGGGSPANGYMDELRISREAVYPGGTTYTPAAAAFADPGATNGDVLITWHRRTRLACNFGSGLVPLGEASEAYDVEVYATSGYATVLRTERVTEREFAYTAAMQIADFGTVQGTVYVRIYQISATVGRGHYYQGAL